MKNILFLLVLVMSFSCSAQVQKYVLTTGTNGYVTITEKAPNGDGTPQDYTRGNLGTSFYITSKGDTQMKIFITNGISTSTLVPYMVDSNYQNGDASSANFPTTDSLYRWTRKHLQKYVGN